MRVSEIRVHPVKSCRPVRLDEGVLTARGFEHDRRFMFVDADGVFVTLRELPRLSLIEVEIVQDGYRLSLPNGPVIDLPVTPDGPAVMSAVWRDRVVAREAPHAAAPLTAWAGRPLRVVGMQEGLSERRRPDGGVVSFADAYPLLAISTATVDDLSGRVGSPMAIDRFRPNLVVDGCGPYEEDGFALIDAGETRLRGSTLCSRCVATTIDPVSGATGAEPLATLARYRRFDGAVYLGVNLSPVQEGTVRVGDVVRVIERAPLPPLR